MPPPLSLYSHPEHTRPDTGDRPECLSGGWRVGIRIMVPGCVRILYPAACEAARMPTESGGAGPRPTTCACPVIRSPAYRQRMGRGVSRPPCGVCRGIRKPTLPPPDRQGSLPTAA